MYYLDEQPQTMAAQIAAVSECIERGIGRPELCELLPAGGARNRLLAYISQQDPLADANASRDRLTDLTRADGNDYS